MPASASALISVSSKPGPTPTAESTYSEGTARAACGAEPDVLEGFRCGADDYVTKPFSVAELVARV
ncbi:MAG TPA: hypothetical protein VMW19_19525 [Myxococcota bacterium]|nr:hypothetical protein [Myxococcota bacterium]